MPMGLETTPYSAGGLPPSSPLPNIYGCTYGGPCAIPETGNHFVYRQQPTATVEIANTSRTYGQPNPSSFPYDVIGVQTQLGDTRDDAAIGTPTTMAQPNSNVGSYPITGTSLTSPAGYLFTVLPGALQVTPARLTYVADRFHARKVRRTRRSPER